jgi:prepilin-type N-terminal cleavage/methylation domain-containing protein
MDRRRAFTLIELLVVIAIIALLLAILVPSLSLAKRKAAAAVCLVNAKNLGMSWYMYQEDEDGRIMSANDNAVEGNGLFVGWIGIPRDVNGNLMSITQSIPPVTDEDEIRGIEEGRLFEYVNASKAYHCPADNIRKSLYDQTTVFVSYGIPECLYCDTNPNVTAMRRFANGGMPTPGSGWTS